MKIKENSPMIIFDNQCYLCVNFAKFVDFFARGKITMVGHYSNLGLEIRKEILDESALDMFWFIDKKKAFGGRAAIIPLMKSIFSKQTKKSSTLQIEEDCKYDCKNVKSVFLRSYSLLTNSKKIDF